MPSNITFDALFLNCCALRSNSTEEERSTLLVCHVPFSSISSPELPKIITILFVLADQRLHNIISNLQIDFFSLCSSPPADRSKKMEQECSFKRPSIPTNTISKHTVNKSIIPTHDEARLPIPQDMLVSRPKRRSTTTYLCLKKCKNI